MLVLRRRLYVEVFALTYMSPTGDGTSAAGFRTLTDDCRTQATPRRLSGLKLVL
jgi:hypothetical protein